LPKDLYIFAATIRYHDGTFYIITTNIFGGGNFYVTADYPVGPWSDPVLIKAGGIDHDLFFDGDGKVDDLRFYNSDLKYAWEPGEFIIYVGTNSKDLKHVKVK
jgi:hypothetical protein